MVSGLDVEGHPPEALHLGVRLDHSLLKPTLTQREKQVLKLVARGDTSEQVAKTLIISERTVNFHVANILHKLNVDSRAAAAAKASEMGLISAWRDQ